VLHQGTFPARFRLHVSESQVYETFTFVPRSGEPRTLPTMPDSLIVFGESGGLGIGRRPSSPLGDAEVSGECLGGEWPMLTDQARQRKEPGSDLSRQLD
jgi:hypothetical protein